MSPNDLVEIWRGGVNAWECDEMGHLNMRFYLSRAQEGLAGLALRLGAPQAFAPHAAATLQVRSQHLRFLREARVGDGLRMTGGIVSMDETEAVVVQLLTHLRDDAPCAAILTRVAHATPSNGRAFPWPVRAREAGERLRTQPPPWATPRSVTEAAPQACTLDLADALDLACILRTTTTPQECDVFGRVTPDRLLGRIAEGMTGFLAEMRASLGRATQIARVGGVALEYRLAYADLPRAGDHLELRAGVIAMQARTMRVGLWIMDPVSRKAWATAQGTVANFDIDARKIITLPHDIIQAFSHLVQPALEA